ncbi:MAG TPA: terminase [Candidatus Saccharimonadia bacterium]|nr:terminase [Candidatus Saccharimonadia bacterium]
MSKNDIEIAQKRLADPRWRLNNLYNIINKNGSKTLFKLNWAQEELYDNMWYCNLVLKARQLGISTYVCLLFLDRCLFNSNVAAGIIAHTLEDAQQMFRRVKFAYDSLPEDLKKLISADNDTSQMLKFSNGSSLRVGTSLRSSTFQYLHISEFGKICAKYPDKAREIITGSLNTVAPGQYIFIESTAEGREGYFYEMCKQAQAHADSGKELSKLDFKFHFYPWWGEFHYRIRQGGIHISDELEEYFNLLAIQGIKLDLEQKCWYSSKFSTQGENMRREFPSTPSECWEVSNEGLYYGKQIAQARFEKRIGHIPYDESLPVFTAWDLGYNDQTSIWFVQYYGKEIRLIDYVEGSGESLAHWLGVVKSKPYVYEKHLAPHDVMVHEYSSGMTRQASARKMGINLIPVKKVDIIPGIDQVRGILSRCFFEERKCAQGIKALENYKKEWNDRAGCWNSGPLHNWASHGADAFRTLATGLHFIENRENIDAQTSGEKASAYLQNRFSQGRQSIF